MKRVRLRFEPPTRFEKTVASGVATLPPFRGTLETELDVLKARLLSELLKGAGDAELYPRLRRAANDAAAVAWTTPFPLLVFPALLEEKAQQARQSHNHQQAVLARSRRLMRAAT